MPLQAEIKRLAELHALSILDTEPEPSFDRITEFARELFGMPVAMISLIDQSRQWLKSCSGLDVPELPRAVSFCTYAIQSDGIMVVPDMRDEPFFAEHPLVLNEPHVRFYAGAPLITAEGNRLGTMCVVDLQPHHDFDEKKQKQLHDLAQMVIEQIMTQGMIKHIAGIADTKNDAITHLMHELRTPLGAVVGCIELLNSVAEVNEKQSRIIDSMKIAADGMMHLLNDHLDLSRLEYNPAETRKDPIMYDVLLNDIHRMLVHKAESKNLQLHFDTAAVEGARGWGDANRIRQILVNLIGNAIKFTEQGSVKVDASIEATDDSKIFVCNITDTGIGIPANDLDRIFNKYERVADQQHAIVKGTGLGLAISKRLAEAMNGHLAVSSREGQGSVFTLRMPCHGQHA